MQRLAMQWLMVVLSFTWPASVQALDPDRRLDEYTLQSWNVRDGLPHNMVHAIEQDADGFLWVATWEGLARFDGRHFVVHDNTNIPGLQSGAFRALQRQANGTLLFGAMREGVWERAQGGWLREQAKAWTTAILRGRDGTLWLGTENGLLRRGADGPARSVLDHRHGVAGQPWVHDLLELADGPIWAATESCSNCPPTHATLSPSHCQNPATAPSAHCCGIAMAACGSPRLAVCCAMTVRDSNPCRPSPVYAWTHCCRIATARSGPTRPNTGCCAG